MEARIQQLRSDLARCLQNRRTIAAYYWSLKEMQDELYKYISLPNCSCGHCKCDCGSIMAKQREEEKTHQLLMGLDDVFFKIRSKLLALHPLPPLNRVFELLLQEEHQIKEERRLPRDLLTEILSRLPVKSLVRFRCVEKSWLSMVDDDREFARLHLKTFKNNRDETRLLFVYREFNFYNRRIDFVVHCADTFETIMKTPCSHLESETGLSWWFPVSSLDGLILLESDRIGKTLKLWNPSLGKYRHVPPLPISVTMKETLLGLGYDPLAKDYNIVKLIFVDTTEVPVLLHSVAIYTVGGSSWKFIPFEGKEWSCSNWRWKCSSITTVYLQGRLYLSVRDAYNDTVEDLLSFDLSKKVFSLVSLPNDGDFVKGKKLVLINGGSSIAFFEEYSRDKLVWVLESGSMKWTKHCSYTLKNPTLLYGKKNGDTILTEIKDVSYDQVMSYNPKKQEYKILQQEMRYNPYLTVYASAYNESLILP